MRSAVSPKTSVFKASTPIRLPNIAIFPKNGGLLGRLVTLDDS